MGAVRVSRGDAALGAAVTLLTVGPALVPYPRPWWALALTVLASVPVVWRRVALLPVCVLVGGATIAFALTYKLLAHVPLLLLPYGSLVCVYTFAAATMSTAWRVGASIALAVGLIVSLALPGEDFETYRYVISATIAAYALGVGQRARRTQRWAEEERARRLAEERASAVRRERTRIARDMHDVVTHSVGLMVVQAEAGPLVVRSDPARAEAVFDTIASTGRDAIGQLRHVLGALHGRQEEAADRNREPRPGIDAVPGLVERARRAGLDVALERRGTPRESPVGVDAAAYRIVQESLTNALRHAPKGSAVRVLLDWAGDALVVRVADTGGGGTGGEEGHGILGMRERARDCGGTLEIDPRGFTVTATLPVGGAS
ncbi:sensor histidine kinase [Pseudonocardia acaciae]|uniref:sensor histidine kinase n=1 Tax=Pseudonocardia acaciae TaxID=551276 RepID=UPI00146FE6CB|nr:histidine kinase [Pseudonocardia acaciae]